MPRIRHCQPGKYRRRSESKLHEAIELIFEHPSTDEIEYSLKAGIFITNMQIAIVKALNLTGLHLQENIS
jgi:hypothetical protein